MYKKVELNDGFVGMENEISKLWKDKDIVKKSLQLNKGGKRFTFYDGPPTANGKPHVGHVITRVMKDIILRYRTMKGYDVLKKAGWDTHGLPVELEVEKELGISGKEQIEEYGVEEFIDKCKHSVFTYTTMWEEMTDKVGFWVDMENPYVTYHNDYIESEWWSLKELWKKGLLYEGHKVMPYCPRCGTALSSHEVAQGYKDVKDLSCICRFKVKGTANKYFLAWTTTPWTLPSNLALCINPKFEYAEVKLGDEIVILAPELISSVLKDKEYEIIKKVKGKDLLGMEYEPLLPYAKVDGKAFVVIGADFVTLTDGTGIVHMAPAYGEDDSVECKKNGIAFINLVDKQGRFIDEVEPWAGKFVRDTSLDICIELDKKGKLFSSQKYEHSYPHCWRCDTPLLYYPKESWFVAMTNLREELLANNNSVNWYPDTIRTGRFGKFLENVIDWSISRDRYWGTPLPIWECECGHQECIGSIDELKVKGIDVPDDIELHKPYIDDVYLKCDKCGKKMIRAKEVIDCWYDSGAMPFAQFHYPFENKELFNETFPAQYITEAVDQTRGWFYSLIAISTAIFGKSCYENCIVMGHVLDKDGQKMSKSKGNVVDPMDVMTTVSSDATRWHFYTNSAPWLPKRFSKDDVAETGRKFLSTLWNVYSFYVLYAEIDKFNALENLEYKSNNIMDKWLNSKLNSLVKVVTHKLNTYDITGAALDLEEFTEELSNWYVRRNRDRFWMENVTDDKKGAYVTLFNALITLAKLSAPFVPYMTEEIYQNLVFNLDKSTPESIHFTKWPEVDENAIDERLESQMDLISKIVKLGRSARNSANIKNRQPLSDMLISVEKLPDYYGDIVKEELNVKNVSLGADLSKYVNFEIKPNLPVLGKEYGRFIPTIKKAIESKDQMELATKIKNGGIEKVEIEGITIELNQENLLITMQGMEGFTFAGEGQIGVILDTTITEELKQEGLLRELLSKIQNMRKDKGFEVMDRINLYIADNKILESVVEKFENQIKKETLTKEIYYNEERSYDTVNINGEELKIFVEVIK